MDVKVIRSYADLLVSSVLMDVDELASPFDYPEGNTKRIGDYIVDLNIFNRKVLGPLLEKEGWESKYSDSHIEKNLRNILRRSFDEGKSGRNGRAFKYLTELVMEVEQFGAEQVIYLPLSNIDLSDNYLKIGPITLLKMTGETYNELVEQAILIMTKPDQPSEQKQQRIELYFGYLKDSVSAKYTCVAYDDRAVERAKEECERVLDLLRFAIHRMGQDHLRITIGLKDEVLRYIQSIPVFSEDGQRLFISSTVVGPLTHFQIGASEIQKIREIGIFDLANLLENGFAVDSFYELLFRGLRWFARGQLPLVKENQFLNFTTCLELFLTTRATEKIADTVARGVAVIVADELEKRNQLKRRMKELYDLRSRISHSGHSAMRDSDLVDLKNITGDFLACLIQRKDDFLTTADLHKWVEGQNFV